MLSGCESLGDCELRLGPEVSNIKILGEVPLDESDIDLLSRLIRSRLSFNSRNALRRLKDEFPCCFALFLVWKAKRSYKDGLFWPPILEAMGLSGVRWEQFVGATFIGCLEHLQLDTYQLPGSLTYVTPVLMHGGIPDSCAISYFQHVVSPFIRNDITEPEAIRLELEMLRQEDQRYSELDQTEKSLSSQIDAYEGLLDALRDYIDLETRLETLKGSIDLVKMDPDLLDLDERWNAWREVYLKTNDRLAKIIRERTLLEEVVSSPSREDLDILNSAQDIEKLLLLKREHKQWEAAYLDRERKLAELEERLNAICQSVLKAPWKQEVSERFSEISVDNLSLKVLEKEAYLQDLLAYRWVKPDSSGNYTTKPPWTLVWLPTALTFSVILAVAAGVASMLSEFLAPVLSIPLFGLATACGFLAYTLKRKASVFTNLVRKWHNSVIAISDALAPLAALLSPGLLASLSRSLNSSGTDLLSELILQGDVYTRLLGERNAALKRSEQLRSEIYHLSTSNPLLTSIPSTDEIYLSKRLADTRERFRQAIKAKNG